MKFYMLSSKKQGIMVIQEPWPNVFSVKHALSLSSPKLPQVTKTFMVI